MEGLKIILNFFSVIVLSIALSACGGSDDDAVDTTEEASLPTLLERNINGFIVKSYTKYSPAGAVLFTATYTINKTTNIITVAFSDGGNDYYYYDSDGQIIKLAVIDDADPDGSGNYPNSGELYYQYNDRGLLSNRTRDRQIDGDIDSTQTWSYDSSDKLIKREYDDDNDGFIDITTTYTWNDLGQKLTRKQTESDGSSTTYTYNYTGNSLQPISRNQDDGSDGTVEKSLNYIYDSSGNATGYNHFDQAGALTSYFVYEYEPADGEVVTNLSIRNFNSFF